MFFLLYIYIVLFLLSLYPYFDNFPKVPGGFLSGILPCIVSPWALTGKIIYRINSLAFGKGPLMRIGRRKIGVLDYHLATNVLSDPNMLKAPIKTSNPMINYGLPFVSDPELAKNLRSASLATALNKDVLSKITSDQIWKTCLSKLLQEISNVDLAIENYVKRALFLMVLDLPNVEELPQMQTGPAARDRMISSIIGDNVFLKFLVSTYRKIYGMPGLDPDVKGTMDYMESLIDRDVSIAVYMKEKGFTREQIKCHLATLFQAGTETTAFALKVSLICLGRYPKIQELLYKKISTLENEWNYSRLIECCPEILDFMYASLNYLTPIPLLRSRFSPYPKELNGINFPAGTLFAISNDFIMQPFRRVFSMENAQELNLSFGYGPRMCPGKHLAKIELCMALSAIIASFKILDLNPESNLEDESLSFITRYWTREHPLEFIPRSIELSEI